MHPKSQSRVLYVVAASLLISSLSTIASAQGSKGKKKGAPKKDEAVLVAATDPLPPLPPPTSSPTSAPATSAASSPLPAATGAPATAATTPTPTPAKDTPPTTPPSVDSPSAGRGFVLVFGSGLGFLGGKVFDRVPVAQALVTFDLKLGAYVTPRFGIMAGVIGGYGPVVEGCVNTCGTGYAYQLPIVAQYTFQDRSRGLYLEGGVALFTTYGGMTDKDAKGPREDIQMSAFADLKLGIGYRFFSNATAEKAGTRAFDLRLGVDLGEFEKVEYSNPLVSVKGEVVSEHQALHANVGLSAGYHFSP